MGITILILVLVLGLLVALFVYRHNGKRNILKIDLVQFFYAFIITPLFFVWMKTFLYFLIRTEINIWLSIGQWYLFDTTLNLVFLYIYAFVVMHSLTKTFDINVKKDPLYDFFEHSEYYHGWLSHVVVYSGAMIFFTIISLFNALVPWETNFSKPLFYLVLLIGALAGLGYFPVLKITTRKPAIIDYNRFCRFMRLVIGVCLFLHLFAYFIFDTKFNAEHLMYWFFFACFISMALVSYLSESKVKKRSLLSKFFKH